MAIILQQLAILYIFLVLGWFFGKRNPEQTERTGIISFLLVNLFLPSKVFNTFSNNFTVSYVSDNRRTIFMALGILLFLLAMAKLIAPRLTKDEYLRKLYRYTFTISNYAYLGYPLIEGIFGSAALTDFLVYCIPFTIYTNSMGYCMLSGRGTSLKRIFNPITCGIFLGMIFGLLEIKVPQVISSVISNSAACIGPMSMLLTGFALSQFSVKEIVSNKMAYFVVAMRLVGLPLIVFSLCRLLGLYEVIRSATMVACMPCGLNTIIIPKLVGEDYKTGARWAFLSHLFSIVTIPLWLSIVSKF